MLIKQERDDIFRAAADGGVDMAGIHHAVNGDRWVIQHRPEGSAFIFEASDDPARPAYFRFTWSVVDGRESGDRTAAGFANLLENIRDWARQVAYVANTPDLWAQLGASRELLGSLEQGTDNAPFTADQQAEIADRIEDVKALVRETFSLEARQLHGLDQKLDEVREASKRVGRKDWLMILYGAAFGMVVNDLIPPNVAIQVADLVVRSLGHIFGLGSTPPAIPG